MKNQPLPEREWEKEFDEKFGDRDNHVNGNRRIIATGTDLQEIKSFISQIEQAAYQRGREGGRRICGGDDRFAQGI